MTGNRCLLVLALLAGISFAVHPAFHHEAAAEAPAHSHSSVPDHCTLCKTQQDSAAPESCPVLLEAPVPTEPALRLEPLWVDLDEPSLATISPRGPPAA